MWFFADNAQKLKFSINDFFSKCDQIRRKHLYLQVTFTEEILNGKHHFVCSEKAQGSTLTFELTALNSTLIISTKIFLVGNLVIIVCKQVIKYWLVPIRVFSTEDDIFLACLLLNRKQ